MASNAPIVTGVSPKEGPPGTKVTVRGENFGLKPTDLISLTICDCDCTLSAEWKSPNKIIARSGPGKGRGDIIIKTRYGGIGTCTVQFRGYHETIGPNKESAVWIPDASFTPLSWDRRSLSPASYQQEDPLGLSVEGNDKKLPEEDLNELFPNGSGDLGSEQFGAGWFLLAHHHTTNFEDLRAGLSFLRRKVDSQKEGKLSFLKANVGSVMDQMETLAKLRDKLAEDTKSGLGFTERLEDKMEKSKQEAHRLFEEVLARRERADATRNALAVLQRFKFLFCLPATIDRNINNGDFDVVINDYARVKNLFGNTDIPMFKKVLDEIETHIGHVREVLLRKLEDVPPNIDDHTKVIRSLINLETPGDPAWSGIECYTTHLTQNMDDLKDRYLVLDSTDSAKKKTLKTQPQPIDTKPHRIVFVEDLVDLMEIRLPDLWKLGQGYFSGELNVASDPSRHLQYKNMVLRVIERFCNLLRAAILPQTLDRNHQHRHSYGIWSNSGLEAVLPWLPHCLRYIRTCYSSLIRIDLPSDALNIYSRLIFDLRLHCLANLFKQTSENIVKLNQKENWVIDIHDAYGGITELPQLFNTLVRKAVQVAHESVLLGEVREIALFNNGEARKEITELVKLMVTSFIRVLEILAFVNDDGGQRLTVVSQLLCSSEINKPSSGSAISWEQRLLAVMCNCHYTAHVILPALFNHMKAHEFPATDELATVSKEALSSLGHRILDQYHEQKCDPLVGTIEPSMYHPKFDWDTCNDPVDVRPYAKEIIVNLIGVRAELYRVPLHLVKRIMCKIVDTVAEELSRLISCVKELSLAGSIQAKCDILAVKEATKSYATVKALRFYKESLESIPPLKPEAENTVKAILLKFRANMGLQLRCLTENL